uniref:Uncharacterized protein n=1 Tax=Rhizophora mucronata TaxID=61149 RepID=A0A2P2J8A4_RHIMU
MFGGNGEMGMLQNQDLLSITSGFELKTTIWA